VSKQLLLLGIGGSSGPFLEVCGHFQAYVLLGLILLEVFRYFQSCAGGLTQPKPAPYSFGIKRIGEEKRWWLPPPSPCLFDSTTQRKAATGVCTTLHYNRIGRSHAKHGNMATL